MCMHDLAVQPLFHKSRWSLEHSPTSHVKDQRQQQRIPTWKQIEANLFLHSELISGNSVHACVYAKLLHLCLTLWPYGPGSSSVGFSRQDYWTGWPSPPPGVLPHPVIEPISPTYPALQWILSWESLT